MNLFGKALSASTLALGFNSFNNQWPVSARLNSQLPSPPNRFIVQVIDNPIIDTPRNSQIRHRLLDSEMGTNQNQTSVNLNQLSETPSSAPSEEIKPPADAKPKYLNNGTAISLSVFISFLTIYQLYKLHPRNNRSDWESWSNFPGPGTPEGDIEMQLAIRARLAARSTAAPSPRPEPLQFMNWEVLPEASEPSKVDPEAACSISLSGYDEIKDPVRIMSGYDEIKDPVRINSAAESWKGHNNIFSYEEIKKFISSRQIEKKDGKLFHPNTRTPFNPETDIYRLTPHPKLKNNDNKRDEPPITTETPADTNPEVNADIVEPTHTEQASEMSQV